MKTLAEKIAVMQAAERGEKIESKYIALQCPEAAWCPNSKPVWDWINFDYRVAKQKKTYWIYVSKHTYPVRWCSSLHETLPVGNSADGMTKTISGKWHQITIEE